MIYYNKSFNRAENPEFEVLGDSFTVKFSALKDNIVKDSGGINGELKKELSAKQKLILETIEKQQGISAKDIAPLLKISIDTVDKTVKFLIKNNYIERRGSKKTLGIL